MSRDVSTEAMQSVNAAETEDAFLILLTLSHTDMAEPLRVTNGGEDVTSRGNLFTAYPFELSLPDDDAGQSPEARLVIDNIDRQIVRAVRSLTSAPLVLIEIVRAAEPDVVEAKFEDFRLTNVSYDANLVQGNLTIEDFTAEPFPAGTFTPGHFPGLF
ncbi:MAG: DUF1833 domain-containing protein [Alphaproteobacteria bacterium]|nr:MAG: DUF1833 domain-containing protein [Alphaproteobacteria bacterium]